MNLTPSRSYLIKALHEWMTDNDLTPYLAVDARVQGVMVPDQFTRDEQLVLNISYSAVQGLLVDHEGVSFSARFGGVPMNVFIPLAAILAIYAKENSQGMGFGMEPGSDELMHYASISSDLENSDEGKESKGLVSIDNGTEKSHPGKKPKSGKPNLTVIK